MVEVGIVLIFFLIEILVYKNSYKLIFSKEVKNCWLIIPAFVGLFIFLLFNQDMAISGKHVISYWIALAVIYFMIQDKWYKKIANLLILFFVLNTVESIIDTIIQIIELCLMKENKILVFDSLIWSFITLIITYICLYLNNNRIEIIKKFWNGINKSIHYMVILMGIVMILTVSALSFAQEYVNRPNFSIITHFLCALSYICIGVLGIFVLYVRGTNRKMKEMLQNEVMLKDMQKHYYEALLEKEEDTRRYRHDMGNHLLCLSSLAYQENVDELKIYLDNIQEQMQVIQKKSYVTGNQILDVLTNYYLEPLQDAKIKVSGHVTEKLEIDNVSLCTIYANLLKNAVEELNRSKKEEKFLNIKFIQGSEYFRMIIQNSLSVESSKKQKMLVTEKSDKKNHGIGLRNVKRTIEENGGKLEINHNKDCFAVEVTLKMTVQEVK